MSEEVRICHVNGGGQFLPLLGDWEQRWPERLKIVLYGMGLGYCFMGVSIIADMFMSAIERITSRRKTVRMPGTQRLLTTKVWNETVANLTLMALGSSAPEILLSLNDIVKRDFHRGKLGPSTIVGSAAFNLFVIIAVCVVSIPTGEVRVIKASGVFVVTGIVSVVAYAWLLFIVNIYSPNIIEVWEGVMTFMGFPLLVVVAYATDIGWRPRLPARVRGREAKPCAPSATPEMAGSLAQATGTEPNGEEAPESQLQLAKGPPAVLDPLGQLIHNEAGVLTFDADTLEEVAVPVFRRNGAVGRVGSRFRMEMLSAVPGFDYLEEEGELSFGDGVTEAQIKLTILPKFAGEVTDRFQVVLEAPTGGAELDPGADGGPERCLLTVTIVNDTTGGSRLQNKLTSLADAMVNLKELRLGVNTWYDQVVEAVYVGGSSEEQEKAGCLAWLQHWVWLPWQALFGILTPPPPFLGGWLCFWCSLFHIGWITVLVSDLAELFGCALSIPDEITAISFVALGTSVPDLFASRMAAKSDPYADASVVNVTGSNSVNVFLGIGLPWMMASLYWKISGPDEQWLRMYSGKYPEGSFVVEGGSLGYSVLVFTLAACTCLLFILARRRYFGGELGGPDVSKAYSCVFLILLWGFYLSLSSWMYLTNTKDISLQILSFVIGSFAVLGLLAVYWLWRKVLLLSKRILAGEGFWGVSAAFLIIGGRIVIFLAFQYQW